MEYDWRKSSYSGGNEGNCVEVAELPDGTRLVRDTKDRNGPVLRFGAAAWRRFTTGIKTP
jgi:Domain of unknown function (DUF397)